MPCKFKPNLILSNRAQILDCLEIIKNLNVKTVGFMGITFKPGTDDLRESPVLEVMAVLLDLGVNVVFYDPNFGRTERIKTQIDHIQRSSPRLANLMENLEKLSAPYMEVLLDECDLLVASHNTKQFRNYAHNRPHGVHLLDLVRLFKKIPQNKFYHGMSW